MPTDPALDALRRYAADLPGLPVDTEALLTRARAGGAAPHRRSRLIPVLAVTMAFVLANAGLAVAANGAAPGDPLYPVDRAYERIAGAVGLAGESPGERLAEAEVVAARGEPRSAVAQTGRALRAIDDAPGLPDAVAAVDEAEAELTVPAPQAETIGLPGDELRAAVDDLIATAHEVADAAKRGADAAPAARKVKEKATKVAEVARGSRPDHAGPEHAPGQTKDPGEPATGKGRADDPPGKSRQP